MPDALVSFHPLAARDYRQALRWYAKRSPDAAERFRREIEGLVQRVAVAPKEGVAFRWRYRWVRAQRFPYVLYYQVIDAGHVKVYAVAHGRRRLGYWLRRAPG